MTAIQTKTVDTKSELEARVRMLNGERALLLNEIESMNKEIELLELSDEASDLESEIARLTIEKSISEDYLATLRDREQKSIDDGSLRGLYPRG